MGSPVLPVNRFSGYVMDDNTGMSIGSRIKQTRKVIKMTQAELAKKSGLNQSTISDLEVGKSQGTTYLATLASALGVNALWLETGKGAMSPESVSAGSSSPFVQYDGPIENARPVRIGDPDTVAIPRVKLRLRAGVANFETEPDLDVDGNELVPRAIIESLGLDPVNLMAIKVRGTSMEPMMFEDDVVIIDKSSRSPINRELFAVNFDGEACIKQMLYRGNEWYLNSINPDFGPVNVKSGQCSIVGRVVIQPTRVLTGRL
jgi:phage repressor protein C with HTH and peptisase S24 domain